MTKFVVVNYLAIIIMSFGLLSDSIPILLELSAQVRSPTSTIKYKWVY